MKQIIAKSLVAAVILGASLLSLRATDPGAKPAAGRVLILENERTLTGDIEQVGDQYRVKRLVGETWVPAEKVLRLCTSLEEAHRYLQGRANLDDPDERLRLADWCRQHGLREEAYHEVKAAQALKPRDERIQRLVGYMDQARSRVDPPKTALAQEKPAPRVDVTADSLGTFSSKVQPILMNACLCCHTTGRGGNFQLIRVASAGLGNRRSMEANLAAVLTQVNARDPQASRLLTKSVSIHGSGMTQAPLKNRQAAAYQTLARWVQELVENNPQMREQAAVSTPLIPPLPVSAGRWGEDRGAQNAAPEPEKKPVTPTPAATSAPKPASKDPVDPGSFNQEFHPEKKPGS
jgi:hypothetical protein